MSISRLNFASRSMQPVKLAVIVFYAMAVAACNLSGDNNAAAVTPDSYKFEEIQNLSNGLLYERNDTRRSESAKQNLPTIVALYKQALGTFITADSTNSSINGLSGFDGCLATLKDIAIFSTTQFSAADVEVRGRELREGLNACRTAVTSWPAAASQPPRIRVKKMTSGALLVIADTMAANGAATPGYLLGQEAAALLQVDNSN